MDSIDANGDSGAPLDDSGRAGEEHVQEASHTSTQTANCEISATPSAATDHPQSIAASMEENGEETSPINDSISTARRPGERNQYPASGLIISEEAFRVLVHEILATYGDEWKIQDSAMNGVQEACEAYMMGVFGNANIEAAKDNQVTLTANHVTMGAREFAREMSELEHFHQRRARDRKN